MVENRGFEQRKVKKQDSLVIRFSSMDEFLKTKKKLSCGRYILAGNTLESKSGLN